MDLKDIFNNQDKPLLNIYCTAGYPAIDSLPVILEGLEEAGVDMVEIGIPYSDPLSDGPTIQESSSKAIANGITMEMIFEQLANVDIKMPKILMGYFNAIYIYGIEKFCQQCQAVGVTGVILPDLPIDIYQTQYRTIFEQYGLSFVFLVTPETTAERIRMIDEYSSSFIYAVSSSSTTGKGTGIQSAKDYLSRLQAMNLKHPLMVGFNISTHADFEFAASYTAGGIIGSAFIKHIADSTNLKEDTKTFVESIRGTAVV